MLRLVVHMPPAAYFFSRKKGSKILFQTRRPSFALDYCDNINLWYAPVCFVCRCLLSRYVAVRSGVFSCSWITHTICLAEMVAFKLHIETVDGICSLVRFVWKGATEHFCNLKTLEVQSKKKQDSVLKPPPYVPPRIAVERCEPIYPTCP